MKTIVKVIPLVLLAMLMVACGGGGEESEGSAPVSFTVTGDDAFVYDPKTLSAPTGSEVTVTFKNIGGLDHNWILVTDDTDVLTVTEADALSGANAGMVTGGTEKTFTFVAPAAGTYKYVCTVAGHAAGGMVGTFTVTE
ncbi:MAG: multicopper oxidase domain-containing protein [Chloroflexi bacterium]|nr:multicopper oxidase domain-containing protein [Chloroflexota bacterium]MBP8054295.1 multicopper oxidase domain-containing protein [Chloroflexota bacterium]